MANAFLCPEWAVPLVFKLACLCRYTRCNAHIELSAICMRHALPSSTVPSSDSPHALDLPTRYSVLRAYPWMPALPVAGESAALRFGAASSLLGALAAARFSASFSPSLAYILGSTFGQ